MICENCMRLDIFCCNTCGMGNDCTVSHLCGYDCPEWIKSKPTPEQRALTICHEVNMNYAENGEEEICGALDLAEKALKNRIKVKECIERINQPEYQDITWKKDEVVLLLQELLAV